LNYPIKTYARRHMMADAVEIHFLHENHRGERFAAQPAVFVPYESGAVIEPAMRLQWDDAQRLMDELWACGIRPAQSHGSAGQLGATQAHLADMQKIADKLLDRVLDR
jgi:hypothetical protein